MKQLLVFLLLLCAASVSAQDVIVKKDGSTIVCRVVELTATEITYKKWRDLNGSNYVMERSAASAINYENGKKVNLSEVENQYLPGNQNDGVQQYNDRALLRMDYQQGYYSPDVKKLRNIGWIGGATLVIAGGICLAIDGGDTDTPYFIAGNAGFGCAIVWTTGFLIAANKAKKKVFAYQNYPIFEKEYKLNNGSTIAPSVDLVRDLSMNKKALSIGLRYNF